MRSSPSSPRKKDPPARNKQRGSRKRGSRKTRARRRGVSIPRKRISPPRPRSSRPADDYSPFFDAGLDLLGIGSRLAFFEKLNPQWEAVLGYPLAEMIGRDFIDFIHPDDRPAALAAFRKIADRRGIQILTNRVRCRDGSYKWLEWKYVLRGGRIFAAARDITDRMRIEEELRESRRMQEIVLNTIPARVFWKDRELRFLGGNQSFAEDSGVASPAELIGRTDFELKWNEQADRYRADDRRVIESGVPKIAYEEPGTLEDGRRKWLRTSKVPLRDSKGSIRGVLGTYEDITEWKSAERALRESEERYQRITRTITDYIYHVRVENGKAVETTHSERCKAVTGYSAEEFGADPQLWIRMADPEDRPLVLQQMRAVLTGRYAPVIEHRLLRKDGARRWVRNTPVLHCDPAGNLLGYDGLIQDITERKKAELQIRAQHELALALAATTSMEKGLRLCLEAALRISGMEGGGVYLVDPGSGAMDLVVDRGLPGDFSGRFRHLEPDRPEARWMLEGQPIYTNSSDLADRIPSDTAFREGFRMFVAIPIRHENQLIGILNLVSAVVDSVPPPVREALETSVAQMGNAVARLRSESELRDSRRMLETILDTIPVRVFWKDRESRYLGCNRWFALDAGFSSPAELIGRDDFQMGWVTEAELYRADDRAVIESGKEKLGYEEPQTHPDGTRTWLRTSKVPLRDPDGGIRGVLGTYEDITEWKRAEEEIRTLNAELERRVALRTEQLEAANRELEAFSYSVSHDLRAPLRAIDGFTGALEEDYGKQLDAEGRRLCAVIRRNTGHMNALIEALLTLSRLSLAELQRVPTDQEALVRSVAAEIVPAEERTRVGIQIGRLPPAAVDPVLFRQVWSNLIANAVKFSSKRERARISVTGRKTRDGEEYTVRDNGAGFDSRYADRMFGVFQRLHDADEFEGNGVGLAIVQRIVHRHGGRVWAEGEVGKGAVFSFSLPRNPPAE